MFLSRNENRNGMGRDMPFYDVVLGKVRQNGRKKTSSLVAMVLALEYSYYQVVNWKAIFTSTVRNLIAQMQL